MSLAYDGAVTSTLPREFNLAGLTALVTGCGSASGIGFATARLLGELGARVIMTATTDRIEARANELRAAGIDAVGIIARLESAELAGNLIAQLTADNLLPDILVNNAGMIAIGEEWARGDLAMPATDWQHSIDANLSSVFYLTRALIPTMVGRGWGRVVITSSTTGGVGAARDDIAYAAAKAGLVGLTRALAVDTARSGVTVNAVAPGWIATGSQLESEKVEGTLVPVHRSGLAHEVATAMAFLASPGASYITGQLIVVDGGNSIAEERRFARGNE